MKHKLFSEYTNTYEAMRSTLGRAQDAIEMNSSSIKKELYDTFDLPPRDGIAAIAKPQLERPASKHNEKITEFPREKMEQAPRQKQNATAKGGDTIAFPMERVKPVEKEPALRPKKSDSKISKARDGEKQSRPELSPDADSNALKILLSQKAEPMRKEGAPLELPQQKERKRKTLLILLTLSIFVLTAAIGTLLAVRQYTVVGISMEPTLMEGDHIYYTSFQSVSHGDIVIFDAGDAYGLVVKRVIGLPGDTIQISANGAAVRNMELLREPYMKADLYNNSGTRSVAVQEGMVFLLGDNRADSIDSRDIRIGLIPMNAICGKVRFVVRGVE